jgi:ATP phosphoribosyltransferase regulatory subunit
MKICEENKNSINYELYNVILQLPKMRGDIEVITSLATLTLPEEARKACEEMMALYAILTDYHVQDVIRFDLGLYLHHDYYTGVVVEAYAQALGQPIGLGGRYDRLLQRFGMDAPATGFALLIERLTEVIRKKPEAIPIATIHYDDISRLEALAFSDWLRAKGMRIICEPMKIDRQADHRKVVMFHEIKQNARSDDPFIHDIKQYFENYQMECKGGDSSC